MLFDNIITNYVNEMIDYLIIYKKIYIINLKDDLWKESKIILAPGLIIVDEGSSYRKIRRVLLRISDSLDI